MIRDPEGTELTDLRAVCGQTDAAEMGSWGTDGLRCSLAHIAVQTADKKVGPLQLKRVHGSEQGMHGAVAGRDHIRPCCFSGRIGPPFLGEVREGDYEHCP